MTVEEASASVEIWPDNLPAYNAFVAMSTQWRYAGMGERVGLDYGALPEVWRRTKTPPAERDGVFDCLRVMEDAALGWMRKQQEKA